ncbi:MAG: hypothetical protein RSE46_13860, partial [Janthinobacterium sp.]
GGAFGAQPLVHLGHLDHVVSQSFKKELRNLSPAYIRRWRSPHRHGAAARADVSPPLVSLALPWLSSKLTAVWPHLWDV